MPKGRFDFKQFSVIQENSAMKVGTDAVLLGSWMDVRGCRRMLDVGTGTGVIALMAAQRAFGAESDAQAVGKEAGREVGAEGFEGAGPMEIIGIDIDGPSAQEAAFNFSQSPWSAILEARCISFEDFACGCNADATADGDPDTAPAAAGKFDLIFSNPPFFSQQVNSPDGRRDAARREDSLPMKSLIANALNLLSEHGRLAVIYPCHEGAEFVMEAVSAGLYLHRQCFVKGAEGKPAKRVLIEMGRDPKKIAADELVISSDRYNLLTVSFYLSK